MEHIAIGAREPELLSSLAGRLIRLEKRIESDLRFEVEKLSGGKNALEHRARSSRRDRSRQNRIAWRDDLP